MLYLQNHAAGRHFWDMKCGQPLPFSQPRGPSAHPATTPQSYWPLRQTLEPHVLRWVDKGHEVWWDAKNVEAISGCWTKRPNQEPQMHLQISSASHTPVLSCSLRLSLHRYISRNGICSPTKKKKQANLWQPTCQHFHIFLYIPQKWCQRSFAAPHGTLEPSLGPQSLEVLSPRLKHALSIPEKGQDLRDDDG